ncbi:MAG: sensor histidine kinase [Tyzzerella sp.]|nr:sensor histidine kinase [Tyzzerella sp.]
MVGFLPYLILSVYVFSKHLRFSKWITALFCALGMAVQIGTRFFAIYTDTGDTVDISITRLVIYILLLILAIQEHPGKLLFAGLISSNIANFIMIAATCIEGILFSGEVLRHYCWHASLIMVVLHLFITLPFFVLVEKKIKWMMGSKPVGNEWWYYWLIPATFYLIWQYQIHGGGQKRIDVVYKPQTVIFLFIINVGSILIYYMIIQLSNQLFKNLELETKNHYRDIEELEYQILEERIEDARRARHDVRHHMVVMGEYLDTGDYARLKDYMNHYRKASDSEQPIVFCPHRTVNGLILYFAHQAQEHEIDFQVQLSIPDKLNIPDIDISVLLGNLLENALDACKEQTQGKRRIIIRGKGDKHSLFFTIDNTCENTVKQNAKGQFVTTKKDGSGIGIESVKHIVERYHGVFTAEKKGEMFCASFMLNLGAKAEMES